MALIDEFRSSGNAALSGSGSCPTCTVHPCSKDRRPSHPPLTEAQEHPLSEQVADSHCSSSRAVPDAGATAPGSGNSNPARGTQPDHVPPLPGMYSGHTYGHTDRSYDYTKKYPADPKGKELEPDARFWKIYLDESEIYDTDMVTGFRNVLDGTLIFVSNKWPPFSLPSSPVSIIEASQKLEPDYALINASLLVENNLLLRAGGNVSKIDAIPKSPLGVGSITHSWPDVFMNSVFFASLSLALVAALFSILVKQWLQSFTTVVRGDAKERCLIRQLRFTGLENWKLPELINALPMFLHASLGLFFVGLGIFVREFHLVVQFVINSIACALAVVYFTALILPAVYLDCPYRLPILHTPGSFIVHLVQQVRRLCACRPLLPFQPSPFLSQEREHVLSFQLRVMASCISWLFTESTNQSVQNISVGSAGGLIAEYDLLSYRSVEDAQLTEVLPVVPMLSFVLRFGGTLKFALNEQLPLVRFLTRCLRPPNLSSLVDLWEMAFHSPALLDLLLEERVPLDMPYSWGHLEAYPFQHACVSCSWEAVDKLLPLVPPSHLAAFGDGRRTPLMLVCRAEGIDEDAQLALINRLLAKSANVGDVDADGNNVLHHACSSQCLPKVLDALLSAGTPLPAEVINQQNCSHETPLLQASFQGLPSHVRALLLAGANADISRDGGRSPLHGACARIATFAKPCDFEVFEKLVDATTDVNMISRKPFGWDIFQATGETPLDTLVSRRGETDGETFKTAYKLMRAKEAHCSLEMELQVEIDDELGVAKEKE